MKRILISAYAVNPYKGSEDGMGWNFICQAARFNKIIAVTRENNASSIKKFMAENPDGNYSNIQFLFFDLPYYMRFWKRGSQGALLYFYLWQIFIPRFIKRQKCEFDIVHNLNFHNDWTPSHLWTLGKPMVWGPIGHHPQVPAEFMIKSSGITGYVSDKMKWMLKKFLWNADPYLKDTIRNTSAVIAMNKSVAKVIPLKGKNVFIIPSVGSDAVELNKNSHPCKFNVLSIGRFVALKGFDVTIKSFALFYHKLSSEEKKQTRLTLIGKGPMKNQLVALTVSEGIQSAVEFVDWVDRKKLTAFYNEADVFLFSSHEGAGMVVPEALSFGVPVICFDNCGPGELVNDSCAIKIPYGRYQSTIRKFSGALKGCFRNRYALNELSRNARQHFNSNFEWNVKGDQLQKVYESLSRKEPRIIKKKKIVCVHLLNDYSGSPLVFAEAIKGLINSGHEIDLYTCGNSKGFLSELKVNKFSFWYKFYSQKYIRLGAFAVSQIILFFRLLKYTNQQVDIYINTLLPCGAALAGKLTGKKVVYHLHETSINPPQFKKFLQRIAESSANTAIYVSQFLMKTEPLRGVQGSVVHNALPDEFVSKASEYRLHKTFHHNKFTVLMLCSLKTYKGVDDFVDLAERMPHISFELVLNTTAENISSFFSKRTLPSNLILHAATNNVHPFYEKADLVLNLSHPDQWIETFGMTILEAMCYGIPVIAPPVGGVTEIVQPNINGFLKDVRSKHDMQNTIHHIYTDPLLCKRLSEQALLTAEKFRLQTMQQMVCELIEMSVGEQ
jgi:glycosyltransferase involved in cell wall biosynthesis